jgi:hypothetical protein
MTCSLTMRLEDDELGGMVRLFPNSPCCFLKLLINVKVSIATHHVDSEECKRERALVRTHQVDLNSE